MTILEIQGEALDRARNGQSVANYAAIFEGFAAKGIPADQISPRENVLTFHAWKALGRSVKKGEHGVKVATFVAMSKEVRDPATGETTQQGFKAARTTTVFHVSQTEATADAEARWQAARSDRAPRRSAWASGHGRYPAIQD
jgi:N-terminal domain of anti-restriction factor ArdC